MAHKKIERKKELDRRRKRRAERIKAAFTKLRLLPRTASKSGDLSCAGAPAPKQRMRPGASAVSPLSEFREIVRFSGCFVSKGRLERS